MCSTPSSFQRICPLTLTFLYSQLQHKRPRDSNKFSSNDHPSGARLYREWLKVSSFTSTFMNFDPTSSKRQETGSVFYLPSSSVHHNTILKACWNLLFLFWIETKQFKFHNKPILFLDVLLYWQLFDWIIWKIIVCFSKQ